MEIVKYEDTIKKDNSENCQVIEYLMKDKDIDCARATIMGRYPDKGYSINEKCKELIHVISGSGIIAIEDQIISFKEKDTILINSGEKFYWNGNCEVIMSCSPTFSTDQYKVIDE